MQKIAELESMLAPCVADLDLGLALWGIEYVPGEQRSLLRLYIDAGDRPVTLEDCESVSREVSALLDVNDPISGNYNLEVSSPGLDRMLFTPEHFARFVGSQVKITLALPQNGRRRLQGTILASDAQQVRIGEPAGEFVVAHSAIQKARIVPEFGPVTTAASGKKTSGKAGRRTSH